MHDLLHAGQQAVPRLVFMQRVNVDIDAKTRNTDLRSGTTGVRTRLLTSQSADSHMTGGPRACALAHSWCQEYGSVLIPVEEIRCN